MATESTGAKCVWKQIIQINQSFASKFERYCGLTWPGWIRISIWTATVAVLSGLMAHELSSNVGEYVSNNIIPQINVITPTGEVRPPNLTVCIPYYSNILPYVADWAAYKKGRYDHPLSSAPCDECEGMKNNSWDVWTKDETMFTHEENDYENDLARVLLKRLFNEIDEASIALNKTNAHWNQAIIDSLWRFYSCKVDMDTFYLAGHKLLNVQGNCRWFDMSSFDYIPDETIDQMFELLLKAIEVYMQLKLRLRDNNKVVDGMRNLTGFIPHRHKMCFPLPWNTHFMDLYYAGVSYQPWHRPALYNITTRIEIYEDVMFHNYDRTSQTLYQTDEITLGSNIIWDVQLTYKLQTQIDIRGQDESCSEDSVPISCVSKRHFENAVQECKCIPFLLRHLRDLIRHEALPYCNETLYVPCKDKLRHAVQTDVSYCTARCEYVDYKYWQVSHPTPLPHDHREFGFYITLLPANGSFIKFNFTAKSTFGQFMSGVGGTLNLYLGLSGFTLCALLFFLIDSINRWRRLRSNSDQQSNPSPAILGLHLFWFTRLLKTSSTKNATQDNSQGQHEDYTKKLLEEMKKLAQDMAEMKGNFTTLAQDMTEMKGNFTTLAQDMAETNGNFTTLADRMNALERKSKG